MWRKLRAFHLSTDLQSIVYVYAVDVCFVFVTCANLDTSCRNLHSWYSASSGAFQLRVGQQPIRHCVSRRHVLEKIATQILARLSHELCNYMARLFGLEQISLPISIDKVVVLRLVHDVFAG